MALEKTTIPFPVRTIDISNPIEVCLPEEYIGIRQHAQPENALKSMTDTGIWNLVQFCKDDMGGHLSFASRLIQNPKAFLDNPTAQVFGSHQSKPLHAGSVVENRWSFRATSQKKDILNTIYAHLKDVPGARTIADSIYYISDELFSNALYNAPFADSEYTLDRSAHVFIDPNFSSEIIISYNAKKLFIGCLDHFGSFSCEDFIKRTAENFTVTADALRKTGAGGAGIGMLRIIDLSPETIVVVEKNKRTLVGCSFPLGTSGRKIRETPKNFYFQSFENIESDSMTLRVETRGSKILARCIGSFNGETPLKALNLKGMTELAIDLRLVKEISGDAFDLFFSTLKDLKNLKRVFFDYVPQSLLQRIDLLKNKEPDLIEVRTLCRMVDCSSCKAKQEILTSLAAADAQEPIVCSACGGRISEQAPVVL